jgi:hypothetical protein
MRCTVTQGVKTKYPKPTVTNRQKASIIAGLLFTVPVARLVARLVALLVALLVVVECHAQA